MPSVGVMDADGSSAHTIWEAQKEKKHLVWEQVSKSLIRAMLS